jgi:hypothetical protein
MKLPGINYGQVQSRGRYDTSAVARNAAAAARVNEAGAEAAREVEKQVDIIYRAESKRQASEAARLYADSYNTLRGKQLPKSADGKETAWGSRDRRFNEMTTEAMSSAEEIPMTGLAQEMFNERIANENVLRKAEWSSKTQEWWLQDGKARGETDLADKLLANDFDGARQTVEDFALFFGTDTYKYKTAIDYKQKYYGFETRGKTVDITRVEQARSTAKLIEDIQSSDLSAKDNDTLVAGAKNEVITA